MMEKVRKSQSEVLLISKNIASNIKRMRGEVVELSSCSSVHT